MAYTHGFKKTVNGANSIPASYGGGNANISLEENILGVAYGWKY
jgi:long-chain fatty acid transport protein